MTGMRAEKFNYSIKVILIQVLSMSTIIVAHT
jgi:hypothetical protein